MNGSQVVEKIRDLPKVLTQILTEKPFRLVQPFFSLLIITIGVVNLSQVIERFTGFMFDGQPAQPLKVLLVSRLRPLYFAFCQVEITQAANSVSRLILGFGCRHLTETFPSLGDQ